MLRERVAPQSEVIRVIVLEVSPCCEVPHHSGERTADCDPTALRGPLLLLLDKRRCQHSNCLRDSAHVHSAILTALKEMMQTPV